MNYDWEVGVDTMTVDQRIEYFIHGNDIVISVVSEGVDIHLSREQVNDMICGLATLTHKLRKSE